MLLVLGFDLMSTAFGRRSTCDFLLFLFRLCMEGIAGRLFVPQNLRRGDHTCIFCTTGRFCTIRDGRVVIDVIEGLHTLLSAVHLNRKMKETYFKGPPPLSCISCPLLYSKSTSCTLLKSRTPEASARKIRSSFTLLRLALCLPLKATPLQSSAKRSQIFHKAQSCRHRLLKQYDMVLFLFPQFDTARSNSYMNLHLLVKQVILQPI
jgi:hypothetical protein